MAVLCLWWGLLCAALAQPSPAVPPPVRLDAGQQVLPLSGRSVYWIDGGGNAHIDQVERAGDTLPWRVRPAQGQYRIDDGALWFRFDANVAAGRRWFLSLGSSGIDRVQFFHRDAAGQWVTQEAGDSLTVPHWPLPGRAPTFELSGPAERPVRYWVRVEHVRVDFAAPLELQSQEFLLASREREQFMLGAYFGLAALVSLIAAANAAVFRDRAFGAYALYVGMVAVGQLAYLGVGAQHVWTHWLAWNEKSTFVMPGLACAAALWFVKTVTEPARFSRAMDLAVWGLIAAVLSAVVADSLLETRASFQLVMGLITVSMLLVAALVGIVWAQGQLPYIRLIAFAFLPMLLMAIFPVARALNLIPASGLTRYAMAIGAVLEMPLMFYALSLRVTRRREAGVRAAALERIDALTGLANPRALLQRLETALTRARSLKHPCALLAIRISNYDAIVQEFGADSVDKTLVVAASHLRRAMSDIDLAARVGHHEFALLLEGPSTVAAALARAQQLVAGGLRQIDSLPAGLTLKFHVAVALLPERDLDAAGSLQWAFEELRSMPADARKLIKPLNF